VTTSPLANPTPGRRPRLRGGLVGAGAAACAVCCAAPLMALLGIGVTGAAATALTAAFAGVVFAVVVAAATVAAVLVRRWRARADACSTGAPGPVAVELGRRPDEPEPAAP
jgi:membrane protein implicated in regulation of membrane protease activity